jgi:hypothetical protein
LSQFLTPSFLLHLCLTSISNMRFTLAFTIAALSAVAVVQGGGEQAGVPAGGDDRAAEVSFPRPPSSLPSSLIFMRSMLTL